MGRLRDEDKAGLYITVIVHLAVLIVLLVTSLGFSLRNENSFVLDFTKMEEIEKMRAEMEQLQKEIDFQEAIKAKLEQELGNAGNYSVRNVAVDRSQLKDDRGTDAEQLYKDAERLQQDLRGGFETPNEDYVDTRPKSASETKKESPKYNGPSVLSWTLEGRKASKLPIPAYRCMGSGEVTVLIVVDNAGNVTGAKVDDSCSSPDVCLRAFAVRAARLSKFSASPTAPARQAGNIVYKFIAQ